MTQRSWCELEFFMALTSDQKVLLSKARTSGVSDVMEAIGFRRSVIVGFRCTTGGEPVIGAAFTIRQVPKHSPATADQRLCRHGEVSRGLAKEGDFVILDAGGRTDVAGWGGHHSERCHSRGVSGVLVNGSIRDFAEIKDMGFAAFHLGTSPISSKWDQETAEFNGSVNVGGVHIKAGDIIVGDEDGLVVIAVEQLDQVIEKLRAKQGVAE
jgi:regulator of RNase E activity RraA